MLGPARFILVALVLASALIGLGLAAAILSMPARSHDWYPMECCHNRDCAPAKVEIVPTQPINGLAMSLAPATLPSAMLVTTPFGSAMVPANFRTRESPDGRTHACIIGGKLVCLFVPPSS